jgi:hypothetical protein
MGAVTAAVVGLVPKSSAAATKLQTILPTDRRAKYPGIVTRCNLRDRVKQTRFKEEYDYDRFLLALEDRFQEKALATGPC